MKKILIIAFTALLISACGGSPTQKSVAIAEATPPDVTEVLYFHGKQRCITCNAIERLAKEVVDSLANDKVVMRIIDITMPENQAIADLHEVTWSSLILTRNDESANLTEMGFTYAKGQPAQFKTKLREAIDKIAQ